MTILFATDGSPSAQAAGTLLASLPLPPDTGLVIVTVVPDAPAWGAVIAGHLTDGASLIQAEAEARREQGERSLTEAAAPFQERGLSVRTELRQGHAGAGILQLADEIGADLIAVGSHGRTGLAAVLVGSTAEYVAKRARGSVLVTRGSTLSPGANGGVAAEPSPRPCQAYPRSSAAPRRILLATDGSEHSHRALERLRDLPLPREASITALHVTESFYAFPGLVPALREEFERTVLEIRRAQRQNADLLVEGTCRYLESAGYFAAAAVRTGKPAEEILAAAREGGADLIVAGARGLSPTREFLLGSVSGRLLRYAPCSVLLAR